MPRGAQKWIKKKSIVRTVELEARRMANASDLRLTCLQSEGKEGGTRMPKAEEITNCGEGMPTTTNKR